MALICYTCLDSPTDPVVTSCGHLFCWPCLYRWIVDGPKPCPVCRNLVRQSINIIPVYTGDGAAADSGAAAEGNGTDAAVANVPPRPNPPLITRLAAATALHEGYNEGLRADILRDLAYERQRVGALLVERHEMEVQLLELRTQRTAMQSQEATLVSSNVRLWRNLREMKERLATTVRDLADARRQLHPLRIRDDLATLRGSSDGEGSVRPFVVYLDQRSTDQSGSGDMSSQA